MNTATAASTGEALAKHDLGELSHLAVDIIIEHEAANQPAAMDFSCMVQNLVTVAKE